MIGRPLIIIEIFIKELTTLCMQPLAWMHRDIFLFTQTAADVISPCLMYCIYQSLHITFPYNCIFFLRKYPINLGLKLGTWDEDDLNIYINLTASYHSNEIWKSGPYQSLHMITYRLCLTYFNKSYNTNWLYITKYQNQIK